MPELQAATPAETAPMANHEPIGALIRRMMPLGACRKEDKNGIVMGQYFNKRAYLRGAWSAASRKDGRGGAPLSPTGGPASQIVTLPPARLRRARDLAPAGASAVAEGGEPASGVTTSVALAAPFAAFFD